MGFILFGTRLWPDLQELWCISHAGQITRNLHDVGRPRKRILVIINTTFSSNYQGALSLLLWYSAFRLSQLLAIVSVRVTAWKCNAVHDRFRSIVSGSSVPEISAILWGNLRVSVHIKRGNSYTRLPTYSIWSTTTIILVGNFNKAEGPPSWILILSMSLKVQLSHDHRLIRV